MSISQGKSLRLIWTAVPQTELRNRLPVNVHMKCTWRGKCFASHFMWSSCIVCNTANPQLVWQQWQTAWLSLAVPVITNPLTASDIDHVIPTEIINMTGSYNKEKKVRALSKLSPSLCIKSCGHWMREITPLLSASPFLPQSEHLSFISLSNYPYSEPMLLASMHLPKGCVAEGLGMISQCC